MKEANFYLKSIQDQKRAEGQIDISKQESSEKCRIEIGIAESGDWRVIRD